MANVKHLANRDLLQHLAQARPDDPLWSELISRFRKGVRVTVLKTLKTEAGRTPGLDQDASAQLIEDLAQEVFVRLLEWNRRALSRFQGRSELSAHTYLNTIAVNVVRDHCKTLRALKTPKVAASLSSPGPSDTEGPNYTRTLVTEGPGPERFVASRELRAEILDAIDRAAPRGSDVPRDRIIFQLFFLEGMTVDEIARDRAIRLSPSGIEKRIRRIRDVLKVRFFPERGR